MRTPFDRTRNEWVKVGGDKVDPILAFDDGDAESWENLNLYGARWLYDPDAPSGEEYRIFYSAGDSYVNNYFKVGLAVGPSLEAPVRETVINPVVDTDIFTDITAVGCQELWPWIKDGVAGTYGGYISVEIAGNLINIYEVESDDRGETWSMVGSGPLIDRGHASADDVWAAKPCLVIQPNGDHWIYYSGAYGSGSNTKLCLAKRSGSTGPATKVAGLSGHTGVIVDDTNFFLLYPSGVMVDGITYMFMQRGKNGSPAGPYDIRLKISSDGETGWVDTGVQINRDSLGGPGDWYIGTPCVGQDENGVWKTTLSCRNFDEIGTTRYNRIGVATLEECACGGGSL